jgi:t-SNARE complex subunit (syntaxin)
MSQSSQRQITAAEQAERQRILAEREEEVKALEQDMSHIQDMFQDVQQLVNSQGRTLDSIEDNLVTTSYVTDEAVNGLKNAEDLQKKGSVWGANLLANVLGWFSSK